MDSFEKMYSVKEVSGITGWSIDTIRRQIKRGNIEAMYLPHEQRRGVRVFVSVRIPEGALKAFLNRNRK